MKKKVKNLLAGIGLVCLIVMMTSCSFGEGTNSKSNRKDTLLEQWNSVKEEFTKVVNSVDASSKADVELRITELDSKGYPKKYEFIGLRNGREFLKYDEDGDIKDSDD